MFSPSVRVFVSSLAFFSTLPVAARPSRNEEPQWFVGCVDASGASVPGLHGSERGRDLDPVTCAARCLDDGYPAAALTLQTCYCSSLQLHGLVISECFHTLSSGGSEDVRGAGERQSCLYLPVGGGQGTVALYRTEGPFLRSISLSTAPNRVRAGKTFVVEVFGNLAGRPSQATGIRYLGGQDLSHVTVDIKGTKSQSLHRVSVPEDGSFAATSDWIFDSPGKYEINVRVSNSLSTLSSTLHLSVLQSSPDELAISVLRGPLGIPSCLPFPQADLHSVTVQTAFLGDPVTLLVHLGEGRATGLCWWFNQERSEENKDSEILTLSAINGWTQQSIHIAFVLPPVCDLKVNGSDTQLTAGESVSVEVELFTSMKHLLVLNLTFHLRHEQKHENSGNVSSKGKDVNSCLDVVSHTRSMDSGVVWTVSLVNARAGNMTTEERKINVCLPEAGCYEVTFKAFDPIGWTQILVQDPAGKLVLNTPSLKTTNQKVALFFSISAGSNVTVSLLLNATLLYRNRIYTKGGEAVVVLLFNHTGTVAVELRAENRVSSQNYSVTVCVEGNRKQSPQVKDNPNWQPPTSLFLGLADTEVKIYAAEQAYPTNADITLMAVANVPDPVEFIWHFGDSKSARTTSRTITKRYNTPGRFDVVVVMSSGQMSIPSKAFPLEIQRTVKLNRLVHQASALQNQTVTVSCRVNVGTNLTFLWSFGDGSAVLGRSTEQHVFHRTGEFRIEVIASNLVSSAYLSSHIFVVDQPCQPPPVKNMGPLQLQVWRYEIIRLGVTYENEIDCDVTGGLHYTWALFDSAGQTFPLPFIDTHRQSLILPSHLLNYETYTATARVQVIGSVVYSNYSVRVKVLASRPVAFIQGGTNIFINNRNTTLVTLDGQSSYDPDFPLKPLSYSWTCKPVSSITSSCFNQHIPTSLPVLTFPVSFLKHNFDQFQFTLGIHSGEHSASSETFLTITPNVLGKVSVHCPQCQGDQLNWDQPFSVRALCEDCSVPPEMIQYTWHLYLVNASSRPVNEVPFCHTVDLRAPSTVIEDPATSPLTPSAADTVNYTPDSAPVLQTGIASKTRNKNQNMDLRDSTTSNKSRNASNAAALPESESSSTSAGRGEELLYGPQGDFDPLKYHRSTEFPPRALDSSGVLHSDHLSGVFSEFPSGSGSSGDWDFSFPALEADDVGGWLDYDVPLTSAEEGDPGISAGRPTGVDGETLHLEEDSVYDQTGREDEGSNLVESRPSVVIQEKTLLDLPRNLVDRHLFESYTYTGTSSSLLSFRPFRLRPGSRYMLEVNAKSYDLNLLGRTQLFLKTKPALKDVTCQVQPVSGLELHTHFSIFCTSGKEDLLYEYSFSVGGNPRRILYQGRDFQYYFRLPSGDPSDDYKVTIYTEIRTAYGTATKPCPVTVQVHPSFLKEPSSPHRDPALELSESGLRNLSALVRFGNSMEIRNYISLLSSILNRLSLDTETNMRTHTHMRSALICTVCELESSEQQSVEDNICVLKDVLKITSQVSFASARRVVVHTQAISDQFWDSNAPVQYGLNCKTLSTLITLLSYTLQAAISHDSTLETPRSVSITRALESDSSRRASTAAPGGCIPDPHTGAQSGKGELVSKKQVARLVADIHQTASQLMLKYILLHEAQEHRVGAGFINLYATSRNSTVISSGSATFHIPVPLIQQLFKRNSGASGKRQHPPCLLSVLTEFTHNPYIWATSPTKLSGPVAELTLYQCGTRRKIHIPSFIQPINTELRQPQRNTSSVHEYVLLHSQVNYHSFNITQEHLQQAVQFSVVFMPPANKVFPVMLLFRMFDRPTPRMHHLQRIHRWNTSDNTARITLPPSYLTAAGVGHLALLNAGKAPKHKHIKEHISYSLTVDGSLCLSWDSHQGAWTHNGCRTQQADTAAAVSCSCHRLRPLTVVRGQLEGSHETADVDLFLSASADLTVPGVLALCVCLYILGLVLCKKADIISDRGREVHYLPDNSPSDPHLYVVSIHTGLCSAGYMSAKVYILLYGEDGVSETKELQVPGCTLFRRNSRDTFILSTADSLGAVWGVHIWHDNSGHSPNWYLKQVEVSEVDRQYGKGRAWLFMGQCWLAASKGNGQVEKMLRVCTRGQGFTKTLFLKLSDYLADFHTWISVFSCPCPNPFTHTQRLTVCLLLLLGYTCVNTVIISQMDDQLPFELGIIDVSAVSVTTGALSVLAVLPAATLISFLFRWREVKLIGSGAHHSKAIKPEKDHFEDGVSVNSSIPEPHLSWTGLQQQTEGVWPKKGPVLQNLLVISEEKSFDQEKKNHALGEGGKFNETRKDNLTSTRNENQVIQEEKDPQSCGFDKACSGHSIINRRRGTCQWCYYLAWTLCLLLSLSCLVVSAVLGMRFSSSKVLLWIHCLFFSLMSCIFFIHPVTILAVAVTVTLWYRKRPDFHSFFSIAAFAIDASKLPRCVGAFPAEELLHSSSFPQDKYLTELLRARQRARYLRLVRPPTPAELRKTRGKKRRETLICNNLRDLSVCVSMLFLVLCITYGSSFHDHFHLNKSVTKQFTSNKENAFMSIQKHEDWWRWMQTSLLNVLYKNVSAKTESHILIGEPILWKMDASRLFQGQVSDVSIIPECLRSFFGSNRALSYLHSRVKIPKAMSPSTCGHHGCYLVPSATVGLGHIKLNAASKLKRLHSCGWLGGDTMAMSVQFTLYSPAPNLFTSVTLLTEQSPTGVLLPSSKVNSVRVYHTPAVRDYVAMICQLLFLLSSLLQLWRQVNTVWQQGLMGYCRSTCNWLEVILLTVTLVYYGHYIHHSVIVMEVVELLQRHNYKGHVDVNVLATCEQHMRTLRGFTLFLLTIKFVTLLRVSRTLAPSSGLLICSRSSLLRPMISGVILLVALSCAGKLLFLQNSWAFSSIPQTLQTLLFCCRGLRPFRGLLLSGYKFLYGGVLYLSSTMLWTAVVMGVVSSTVRNFRRSRGRRTPVFTVVELASWVRQRFTEITLQRRPAWTDNDMERRTGYLEEFESLVDELLFRLNALSNSPHRSLPSKAHFYMEEDPVASSTQEPSSVDTQDFVRIQMIEETKLNDHINFTGRGETLPTFNLLRLKLELKILRLLQKRNQGRNNTFSQTVVTSDNQQQSGKKSQPDPNDRELQTYLREQNCPSLADSASLIRVWAEGVLQKQTDQWTKTKDNCWLKTQATHTEVVVEALVHEEPERGEAEEK